MGVQTHASKTHLTLFPERGFQQLFCDAKSAGRPLAGPFASLGTTDAVALLAFAPGTSNLMKII